MNRFPLPRIPTTPTDWARLFFGVSGCVALLVLVACATRRPQPPTAQRPQPIRWGLERCTETPDTTLTASYRSRDAGLGTALDRSLRWYQTETSRDRFPVGPISHRRARLSLAVLGHLLHEATSAAEFARRLREDFRCYRAVGRDGRGMVRFTGYYSPVYPASRTPTPGCRYPLYHKPSDLAVDPHTGDVLGRPVLWGWLGYDPYPDRRALETGDRLGGDELVYLCSRLDQYFAHIQGAARLRLRDGGSIAVGYAASNGREYVSVGRVLERREKPSMPMSMQGMRRYLRRHPEKMNRYLRMNPRFIFFRERPAEGWPTGHLGTRLQAGRSLATARGIFPPAAPVLVRARVMGEDLALQPLRRWMFNQDTGGAFRTPGHADIYFGEGSAAGRRAGRQSARGRMYFFFLREQASERWQDRLHALRPRG